MSENIKMIPCNMCGQSVIEDPLHPGFVGVHKCYRVQERPASEETPPEPICTCGCIIGDDIHDIQCACFKEPTPSPILTGGEEIERHTARTNVMKPPKCPSCSHAPINVSAVELVMGNLQCIVFSCADCRNTINIQVLGQVVEAPMPMPQHPRGNPRRN